MRSIDWNNVSRLIKLVLRTKVDEDDEIAEELATLLATAEQIEVKPKHVSYGKLFFPDTVKRLNDDGRTIEAIVASLRQGMTWLCRCKKSGVVGDCRSDEVEAFLRNWFENSMRDDSVSTSLPDFVGVSAEIKRVLTVACSAEISSFPFPVESTAKLINAEDRPAFALESCFIASVSG